MRPSTLLFPVDHLFGKLLDFRARISQGLLAVLKLYARDEPVVIELFRLLLPFLQPFNFVFVQSGKLTKISLDISLCVLGIRGHR
jgi:uncharacterized membrane protein YqaE (UPF0057 family)